MVRPFSLSAAPPVDEIGFSLVVSSLSHSVLDFRMLIVLKSGSLGKFLVLAILQWSLTLRIFIMEGNSKFQLLLVKIKMELFSHPRL